MRRAFYDSMLAPLLTLFLATIALPAKPAHYVTDNAGVLPADRMAALDKKLATFDRQTSDQILVYIDRKVPKGSTIEQVGAQAVQQWGLGTNEKNNGAVLFVFVDEGQTRIEVTDGLEQSLNSDRAKLITSAIMTPRMQQGDYAGAIEHGVEAMLNSVNRESYEGHGRSVAAANALGSSRSKATMLTILGAALLLSLGFARKL